MNFAPTRLVIATALAASLAIVGCKKEEEVVPVTDPATTAPATDTMPATDTPPPATSGMVTQPAAGTLTITTIDMGDSVGPDNRVAAATTTFDKNDTIYTSIVTDGVANDATLAARWTYEDGQEVAKEEKKVTASGPMTHEFHASNPQGWPAGKYKVEVMLDGNVVQTREFEVKG